MDAAGNFTSMADFKTGQVVRFISYLDPNLCIGTDGDQRLPVTTTDPWAQPWAAVVRHIDDDGSDSHKSWQITVDDQGFLRLGWLDDMIGQLTWFSTNTPSDLITVQDPKDYRDRVNLLRFTIDWVDGCWFALNNYDHSRVVDVSGSLTNRGNPVVGYKWNGGDNQKWRCCLA